MASDLERVSRLSQVLGQPQMQNGRSLNWKRIAQTLNRNLFFPRNDSQQQHKFIAIFVKYCEEMDDTVDLQYVTKHLCLAYYNDNDEPYMFYEPLWKQLKYELKKRHQFYHVLLHQYVQLSHLNQQNITQIITKIALQYTPNIRKSDILRVVQKEKIDGSKLRKIVNQNDHKKLSQMFRSSTSQHIVSITSRHWKEIHFFIKVWKHNLSPLTIECIPSKLTECDTNHLVLICKTIAIKRSKKTSKVFHTSKIKRFFLENKMSGKQIASITLQQFVDKATPHQISEANVIFNGIQSYFKQKKIDNDAPDWQQICDILQHRQFFDDQQSCRKLKTLFTEYCSRHQVSWKLFKNHLCGAYNKIHNGNDDQFMFYGVLTQKLRVKTQKRYRFYTILLYGYLKLSDLSQKNLRDVLPIIIDKFVPDIDAVVLRNIKNTLSINGIQLQQMVHDSSCNQLKDALSDLLMLQSDIWLLMSQFLWRWDLDKALQDEKENDVIEEDKQEEPLDEAIYETQNCIKMDDSSWTRAVSSLKECNSMEVIFILQNYVLCDPKVKKKVVQKNKKKIIEYFSSNDIDGKHMNCVHRKVFIENLVQFVDESKLLGTAGKIYNLLHTLDVSKINREQHKTQQSINHLANERQVFETPHETEEKEVILLRDDRMGKSNKSNVLQRLRSFHCGHKIPFSATDNITDPYPSYIYKSIWHKSEDENLEMLVDECVRKIEKQEIWNHSEHIRVLYEDGLFTTDYESDKTETYYDFVKRVYDRAGGNAFFAKFVAKHYGREIKVWKLNVEFQRVLKTDEQIAIAMRNVSFNEFDIDKDRGIDFNEFQKYFRKLGYFVEKRKLREFFDKIDAENDHDGRITKREYAQWKENSLHLRQFSGVSNDEFDELDELWCVYYNKKLKQYEFEKDSKQERNRAPCIAKLSCEINEDTRWAIYHPLVKSQKNKFAQRSYQTEYVPNGYWVILNHNKDLNGTEVKRKLIKQQMASERHLDAIYKLLHHYYTLNVNEKLKKKWKNDDTDLRRIYCSEEEKPNIIRKISSVNWNKNSKGIKERCREMRAHDIRFCIDDTVYKLLWWNEKGKHDANAITLQNVTYVTDEFEDTPLELHYMRFGFPRESKVVWQWYDNNSAEYREYPDEDTKYQLEVSYQANLKQNFDPSEHDHKFNDCLLTKLKQFRKNEAKNKDYVFHAIFVPAEDDDNGYGDTIHSMEQISFDHEQNTDFSRNIKRLQDGRNSLDFLYRDSDAFVKKWQIKYQLYTENQQLYFFAFMTSIVAMMKYIDIEFANQPVVIPLYMSPEIEEDVIEELIQPKDVMREQKIATIFQGCLIPPSGIWSAAMDKKAEIQPSKTNILKKAHVEIDEKEIHQVYLQDINDYPHLYFTKQQAEFMRLLECVRKYALEFEAGSTEYKLWPWYRNSFHSDGKRSKNFLKYDELVYKHNFAKAWSLSELMGYLKKHSTSTQSNDEPQPIRFKRKFAAEMLLAPHNISRNINLIRNQLHSLFNDIMDKALTPQQKGDKYVEDAITMIAFKHNLAKSCMDKQKLIRDYCQKHICFNKECLLKSNFTVENVMEIIDNVCTLGIGANVKEKDPLNRFYESLKKYVQAEDINAAKLATLSEKKFASDFVKYENKSDDPDIYNAAATLWIFLTKYITSNMFWRQQIEETNKKFKLKYDEFDHYALFDENIKNLDSLQIDRYNLLIFQEWMEFFFINADKKQYLNSIMNRTSTKHHAICWYRTFLQSWRETPLWYTYAHDVLLLEVVLRNGIHSDAILKDLDSSNSTQYRIRLNCTQSKTIQDPYYSFRRFCSVQFNIYHRLKYITTIIVKNLQIEELSGNTSLISIRIRDERDQPTYDMSGILFTDYQRDVHIEFVEREPEQLVSDKVLVAMSERQLLQKYLVVEERRCCGGYFRFCCKKIRNLCRCKCCCCLYNQHNKYNQHDFHHLSDKEEHGNTVNLTIEFHGLDENIGDRFVKTNTDYGEDALHYLDATSPATVRSFVHQRYATEHQMDPKLYSTTAALQAMPSLRNLECSRYRDPDPFIERNANAELSHALQAFNLFVYGQSLVECIIKQLEKQKRPAYWYILGEILHAIPYPLAISMVKNPETNEILRHAAKPETLNTLCLRLMQGSSFQTSAALGIAELFEDLSESDMIQEEVWKNYSEQYEVMAYDQMSRIESNHLLFIILNIPLTQHDGKSLFELALDQKRIGFLNNDRINDVINHLYQSQFLTPEDEVLMKSFTNYHLLIELITHPFRFYFMGQGYHWISTMLYMLYLAFIMFYVYSRPIGANSFNDTSIGIEIALWSMNIGYVLYEVAECAEKGFTEYMNLGPKGQANILDVAISALWLLLLAVRCNFIMEQRNFDISDIHYGQKVYIFLFGVQIIFLTIRGLSTFSNTIYIGTLIRVIKLMGIEITKFLFIFIIVMAGFVFGLWLISAANSCEYQETDDCDLDYEIMSISDAFKYVFQVFIGTGDLEGVVDDGYAIIFMVGATLFGTLILTNLLIALMTSEYEKVQDAAKGEVLYNQASLTYDLSKRSRMAPPPLNIIVWVIAFAVYIINFFTAMICPSALNIYSWIDHQLFFNLQNWQIWYGGYDKHKFRPVRGTKTKYKTRRDVLRWYCCAWWYDLCMTRKKGRSSYWSSKIHHKACYGLLILQTDHHDPSSKSSFETTQGITMSSYLERYEIKRRQKVESQDKQLLKRLTGNTLFCEHCCRPFLKDNVFEELSTPFKGSLDLLSAIIFVIFPVVWIPLILMFALLALRDYIFGKFDVLEDDKNENYKYSDFDKEYFANQFQSK